ncbi:DNA-binding protein [Cardiobacterium hominis]|uniref:DNA-binding protein n=1 Tax=Cardiobacterium hominis TaxID=2718 RepID=UPI00128CA814|nr:DNA-binding protein [Cardiobacterium hominis]
MNLKNGTYVKGEIRGVKSREVVKRDTGERFEFFYVVVEDDPVRDKKDIQLSRDAVNAGLYSKLQGLVGRVALIPAFVSSKNNYLSWHYAGVDLPMLVDRPAQEKAS